MPAFVSFFLYYTMTTDFHPTFSLQNTLPRLPVPSLEETCALYLKTIVPLQTKEEHEKTRQIVQDFLKSELSKSLQQRLIDLDRASPNNWLEDNFWLRKGKSIYTHRYHNSYIFFSVCSLFGMERTLDGQ